MTHRPHATIIFILLGTATVLGCAAGQSATQEDAAPQRDAGGDVTPAADDAAADAAAPGDAPDAAATDGPRDAAPQTDVTVDTAPQTDAGQDAGCPAGHTGVNCADCLPSLYKCDQQCVQSCASCNGMPATCSSPKECMTRCTSCSAACVDCPSGYHLCPTSCYPDGADTTATGCKYTCDGQPCAPPAHSTAVCTGGNCDFTCDAAGHWVKSGAACVCDAAGGFVEDQGACVCDASANLKLCGASCVATTPANGCAAASCTACTAPAHGTAVCDGGGNCDFTCDAAGHWVKSGAACVCDTGYKDCGGTCVATDSTATSCADASCAACAQPAHSTAVCTGGSCDFTCDAAGHWVKSGSTCACDSGYYDRCGTCVAGTACPGSYDCTSLHCYWYVSTGATFDAAEAACVAQGAHLASIDDAAENAFVLNLAGANFWIGLKDYATVKQSTSPDDCTSGAWIDSNGGTYTGSTSSQYDDYDACNSYASPDVVFSINIQNAGIWVFSLSNSGFDTVLGLYDRAGGSGYTGCIGSNLACDDDSGSGSRSLIVRNMAVGQYVLVVDGYDDYSYGSYQLDVRRFQWTDATANTYNNWNSEEPNNSSTNEYCVEMYKSSNAGKWNDIACSTSLPYVCERAF